MVTTVAGTNPYAAPEILDYQTPTDRVDIYSLGCVFAFMLTGKSPKQMSREEFQSSLSKSVRKIINKCTADYSRRYKDVTHLKKIFPLFCPLPQCLFRNFFTYCQVFGVENHWKYVFFP